jgi:NTE family protein
VLLLIGGGASAQNPAVPVPDSQAVAAPQAPTVSSQASSGERPRIGLVLSGGGARGAAHVGVLKALEEMHVPVDAIVGTSMGAVVGGLYASGMSAADIEKLMNSIDWQDAFRDRPSRKDLAFRRKQDDRDFPVRLPLGLKGGKLLYPRGLIQGQKLNQMLRLQTLPVSSVERFDDLPIPFRAVAADIETGETVVLDHGDLATAMRASMSAPGVFEPVEIDRRVLVDGGLAENLPADIARAMHVDVLIVSDVSATLQKRDALTSPLDVSNQMLAILIRRETERQRATLTARDVVIEPALGTMTSFDFNEVHDAIAGGEAAARGATTRLSSLGLPPDKYAQYLALREVRNRPGPEIDFVRTDPRSQRYEKIIDAAMQPLVGKPLDTSTLEKRITELYGLDLFETVDYRMVRDQEQDGLEVRARRKSWGPNYVRFSLNLQDDFEGNASYNAASRFIITEVNRLGAEWVTDLQIGENPLFRTEFYQPISYAPRYFIAPQLLFEVRNLQLLNGQVPIAEYRVRSQEAELAFGREFGSWGELRVGVRRGQGQSRVHIGDPSLPESDFDTGEVNTRFAYDGLDNLNFPRNGQSLVMEWTAGRAGLGDDASSDILNLDALVARSWGRHTVVFWASGGSTVHDDSPTPSVQDFFTLGGFLNLSGLTANSIAGPHYGIARILYYRQIGRGDRPGLLSVPVYAGLSFEAGNAWAERSQASLSNTRKDGSLFLGLDTFLGPIYIAAGYDSQGETAFYLFVGRPF